LAHVHVTDPVVVEGVDWSRYASGLIKSSLKRRDLTYADLVEALARQGVKESEPNLRNKLSRGSFTAAFLLQCLAAIGISYIDISDVFVPAEVVGNFPKVPRLDEAEE
tara:strand:+ start:108290 stop:108613 length:324 start_codon:yes stop_codon:yes gene_type:complete